MEVFFYSFAGQVPVHRRFLALGSRCFLPHLTFGARRLCIVQLREAGEDSPRNQGTLVLADLALVLGVMCRLGPENRLGLVTNCMRPMSRM